MSARAYELPQEEDEDDDNYNDDKQKTEIMEDVSFSTSKDDDYPVMAQIEMLYTISQTFTRKKIGQNDNNSGISTTIATTSTTSNATNVADDGDEENSSSEDKNKVDGEEEHTMETAWVAVFEGWIEGKDPLEWKLVDNRPAWEFPMMARSIN